MDDVALDRTKRRIALTYRVGMFMLATGFLVAYAADLLEKHLGAAMVVVGTIGAGTFILGCLTILVWGAMSRRFKKRLERK